MCLPGHQVPGHRSEREVGSAGSADGLNPEVEYDDITVGVGLTATY